jgi:hypothetical protein
MSDEEHALFRMLIQRTQVLCTVVDNAAEVLSDDFKDMVTDPLLAVRDVLARCPDVGAWDGSFSEDDITVEVFRHDSQRFGPDVGIRITHVPTELKVESYSKNSRMDNELVARRALAAMVATRWEQEQMASQRAERPSRRRTR